MTEEIQTTLRWFISHPELHALIFVTSLLGLAWLVNWLVRRVLLQRLKRLPLAGGSVLTNSKLIRRLTHIIPALIVSIGIALIPDLDTVIVAIVQNAANAFILLTVALAVSDVLDIVNTVHQSRPNAHLRPIKGYIQVIKIILFVLATILIVAILVDRSPLILLSGIARWPPC